MATRREQLVRALCLLAAPGKAQIAYLERAGGSNDELALEFDGIYCARIDMMQCGEITQAQADCGLRLDAMLSAMSGEENADLWTDNGIQSAPEWEAVRAEARQCLQFFPTDVMWRPPFEVLWLPGLE